MVSATINSTIEKPVQRVRGVFIRVILGVRLGP
jgi:hypothetical protein